MKPRNPKDFDSALALYKAELTYQQIGDKFGVTRERARQMVCRGLRRHQRQEDKERDPLYSAIHELDRPGSIRVENALKSWCYDGDYHALAAKGPAPLVRVKNLGQVGLWLIARALTTLGAIEDEDVWLNLLYERGDYCPRCGRGQE